MVDIDGIPAGQLAPTLALVKGDPHTFLAHVTISGNGIRLSPAQVGRTLRELGFTSIHTRNGNFWLVAERTVDEINASLPEPSEPSV